MNKRVQSLLLAFFVVAVLLIPLASTHAADLNGEFLGIPWGAPVSDLKEMKLLHRKGATSFYAKPGVVHSIYEVKVPEVIYGFHENRFFAVYVNIKEMETFSRVKRYIVEKYGEPKRSAGLKSKQVVLKWKHQDVRIKLKNKNQYEKMKLAFYYLPISRSLNEAELEETQSGGVQFLPIEKDRVPDLIPLLRF